LLSPRGLVASKHSRGRVSLLIDSAEDLEDFAAPLVQAVRKAVLRASGGISPR
jgi:hypothetical protein